MLAKGQPELESGDISTPVLPEEVNAGADGSKKAVRFGSLHVAAKPLPADALATMSEHPNAPAVSTASVIFGFLMEDMA